MTLYYPNGQPYKEQPTQAFPGAPSGVHYGHRGMPLEEALNLTNAYYLSTDRAVIYKKPTPIQVVHVDYPARSAAKITEAYYRKASTTDYNGVYRGKYIDFEAKETGQAAALPLKNFHAHQISHISRIRRHGGIGFIIVRFTADNDIFLLDASFLEAFWQDAKHQTTRRSIPKSLFQEKGHLVPIRFSPRIDYLTVVDRLYF
ncbi:MAG: Holliday junction resolvase RecU [Sporolactobacillus sp.]